MIFIFGQSKTWIIVIEIIMGPKLLSFDVFDDVKLFRLALRASS